MATTEVLTDTEEGLREVLQHKIDEKIEEGQRRSKDILDRIERDGSMLEDFIAPLGQDAPVYFDSNGSLFMEFGGNGNSQKFTLHPHAAEQAGEKLGIPSAYIRNLALGNEDWQRRLAARTLNDHCAHSLRQRVLVRSVGNQIRGVLSDQYRRLSSPEITKAFITEIHSAGARVFDAYADDLRFWLEVLLPTIIPIKTQRNGIVHLAFGLRLANSDFGDGALEVRFFFLQGRCLNGSVLESVMRRVHLGGRIPDDFRLSDETYRLDTQTQASVLRDIVRQLLSKEELVHRGKIIQGASEMVVDLEQEIKRLPRIGLVPIEVQAIQKKLLESNLDDGVTGEPTLWKLSQAVSAVARDVEQRRQRELQEIAGELMLRNN